MNSKRPLEDGEEEEEEEKDVPDEGYVDDYRDKPTPLTS